MQFSIQDRLLLPTASSMSDAVPPKDSGGISYARWDIFMSRLASRAEPISWDPANPTVSRVISYPMSEHTLATSALSTPPENAIPALFSPTSSDTASLILASSSACTASIGVRALLQNINVAGWRPSTYGETLAGRS